MGRQSGDSKGRDWICGDILQYVAVQIGRGEILQYVSVGKTEVGDGRMMARARRNEGEPSLASRIAGRVRRVWRLLRNDKSGQTRCDKRAGWLAAGGR